MQELIDVIYDNGKLDISSSVFVSMYKGDPQAVIWKDGKDVYITDYFDYGIAVHSNHDIKKLYETTDPETVLKIYDATACAYIFDVEERVSRLLSVIGYKPMELRKVDKE